MFKTSKLKDHTAKDIKPFMPLFQARSVALVGASANRKKWGYIMLRNLIDGGYQGTIYPVNPNAQELLGKKVYRTVEEIPETPDLAVIVVPTEAVLSAMQACAAKGIKAAVIITAGFAELGSEGKELQERIVETARRAGIVFIGPNCNGFMNPWDKLYIDFPNYHVPAGGIALVCQSGGIMDGLVRQIMIKGMGCSLCVASGNEADLRMEDYLTYLAEDPHTKVILCYIEGFKDGERFLHIAREVTRKKPVVVVKAGRTKAGAKAAASHTASIAGDDAIFDAVCKQAGVCRVKNLQQMLNIGVAFVCQPLPKGRRVGIVTAGGGWGVMTADECISLGLDIPSLPLDTIKQLDTFLPNWWNRSNPIDLVNGSTPDSVLHAVETVLSCPDIDAMIYVGLMPALKISRLGSQKEEDTSEEFGNSLVQAAVDVVTHLNGLSQKYAKPVVIASEHLLASPDQELRITRAIGECGGVCYQMPHEAAEVMAALVDYGKWVFGEHRL